METTTVRISKEKRDILKIIASVERREMKDIFSELIDDYIERHRETLELLSRPLWLETFLGWLILTLNISVLVGLTRAIVSNTMT